MAYLVTSNLFSDNSVLNFSNVRNSRQTFSGYEARCVFDENEQQFSDYALNFEKNEPSPLRTFIFLKILNWTEKR